MCSVGVSKNFKKGARDVAKEDRKSNRLCSLVASVSNLLVPETREASAVWNFNVIIIIISSSSSSNIIIIITIIIIVWNFNIIINISINIIIIFFVFSF